MYINRSSGSVYIYLLISKKTSRGKIGLNKIVSLFSET